ncbi:hypothetical protein [Dyadobacter bucti]
MQGLSPRNLKYMRQFATAYPDRAFCASGTCTNYVVSSSKRASIFS